MPLASAQFSAIRSAKEMMLADGSAGEYLQKLGQNYGLPKYIGISTDAMYQQIIQLLAWQPKTALSILYYLMQVVFGPQSNFVRPWKIFEVNANEIIIEMPAALLASTNENAAYLHGSDGLATIVGGPTNTFTTPSNVTAWVASAGQLVGLTVEFFIAGSWVDRVIASASWDGSTQSTVVITTSDLPTGNGVPFHIDIPGDNVVSYRGDYLPTSTTEAADTPTTAPHNDRVYLAGDGLLDVVKYYYNNFCRAAGVTLRIEKI